MIVALAALIALAPQDPAAPHARVAELTRELRGDVADRRAAAEALGRFGAAARAATPALAEALTDEDPELRRRAAWALGRIGSDAKAAVPALGAALRDEASRHFAAAALGRIGPAAKDAVPALVAALEIRGQGLRDVVALALGRIGPDAAPAIPALIRAIGTRDELCNVHGWAVDLPGHRDSHPALIELLIEHPHPELDWWSGDWNADRVERVIEQLFDGLSRIEWTPIASWALWRIGPAAIPRLVTCLEARGAGTEGDPSTDDLDRSAVVSYAAAALAKFGPAAKPAVPALLELVATDGPLWEDYFASILVQIGPVAIPDLARAAANADRDSAAWARDVLAAMSAALDTTHLPALEELARDGDEQCRDWAQRMVRDIERRRSK